MSTGHALIPEALGDRVADRLWEALKSRPNRAMTFTEVRDLFHRNVHVEAVVERLVRAGIAGRREISASLVVPNPACLAPVDYRSSGRKPVRFAMRANIWGPISALS